MSSVEVLSDSLSQSLEEKEEEPTFDEKEEEIRDEDSDGGDSWIVVDEYSDGDVNNKIFKDIAEVTEISDLLRDTSSSSSSSEEKKVPVVEDDAEKIKEFKHIEPHEKITRQCPRIKKGVNYLHKPNQELNIFLTASVVLGLAVVLGFGFGHFLGWSEKLEIHDMNHTDLSQPTDESVDEELLMIERLKSENEELRASINEANLLRNQIQNLEKEIEKLRLNRELITENLASQKSIDELRAMLDQTNSLLRETKENLNDITSENEILKIEVGKARYGKPVIPIEEKEKINKLMTENEELKQAVRKVRNNIPSSSNYNYPSDDCTHSKGSSCKSEDKSESYFDQNSDYINYAKEILRDSTEKAQNILDNVHYKFNSDVKPTLKVVGSNIYTQFKDLAQNLNIEEKIKKTMNAFGIDEQFKGIFYMDEEDDAEKESQRRNDAKKKDNSWYLQRGKHREFYRNKEFSGNVEYDNNNWLFLRAFSRKISRKNRYDTANYGQFDKKYKNHKKYHKKYNNNNYKDGTKKNHEYDN